MTIKISPIENAERKEISMEACDLKLGQLFCLSNAQELTQSNVCMAVKLYSDDDDDVVYMHLADFGADLSHDDGLERDRYVSRSRQVFPITAELINIQRVI